MSLTGPWRLTASSSDIQFSPPFPAVVNSVSTHITYLDTTGRPAITLKYQQLTDRHTGMIYVSAFDVRLFSPA